MSNTTKEVIASMLTENVGTHFLDSGGVPQRDENGNYIGSTQGYGRSFERNQGRNFEAELSTTVKFESLDGSLDISMEHNLYHWLSNRLELDKELDNIFHGIYASNDKDKYWEELAVEFPAWVAEHVSTEDYSTNKEATCEVGGIYNEGKPKIVNSYNGEDMLSQVIQYVYFTWNHEVYIILQIHGGADVRGGYTIPRVFRNNHDDETAIFDHAKGRIYCTGKDHHPAALRRKEFQETQVNLPGIMVNTIDFDTCHANWYTDDSCNFREDDNYTNLANLEDMPCVDLAKELENAKDVIDLRDGLYGHPITKPGDWRPGIVCVLGGIGYCPKCGARLAGSE